MMEILIEKAVLHILDKNANMPVISKREIDLEDDAVYKFIVTSVKKLYDDMTTKRGEFREDSFVLGQIKELENNFMEATSKISEHLYKYILMQEDIPSGDMLFATVLIEDIRYLAMIKLNYKSGYTHLIEYNENEVINKIIKHRVIFSAESSSMNEGALVNLVDYKLKILEKVYMIDGEKSSYFSKEFLSCKAELSKKESIKIINEVAKEVSKKYFDEDFTKPLNVKKTIYEDITETGTVTVANIAKKSFGNMPEIEKEYVEEVKKAGVKESILFNDPEPEKKFGKHKIKTDSGVELSLPMEMYSDKESLEFINNPDGTVSILIKNVGKIINK